VAGSASLRCLRADRWCNFGVIVHGEAESVGDGAEVQLQLIALNLSDMESGKPKRQVAFHYAKIFPFRL